MHYGGNMAKEVIITADKVRKRKIIVRIVKIALLSLLLLLIVLYIILKIIYSEGRFTITLDSNDTLESGITIYESENNSQPDIESTIVELDIPIEEFMSRNGAVRLSDFEEKINNQRNSTE